MIVAYWALMRGAFWALDEHPFKVFVTIVVAGLPIGFYATRYANQEAQKRAIWSGLRDKVAKSGLSISESDPEDRTLGAAYIDDVVFEVVTIRVTKEGIRLDRPSVDDRPISIPWAAIQRIDRLTQRIKGEPVSAAAIRALESDVKLIVAPWKMEQHRLIPSTVGASELRVPK